MIDPSRFAIKPPDPYKFRNSSLRALTGLLDMFGEIIFRSRKPLAIKWDSLKKVSVLRLDGIGDVLLTSNFFRELKLNFPKIEVDLWVGPWAKDSATMIVDVNCVKVFESASWKKAHSRPWSWGSILKLSRELKREKYDLIIDLRGDIRHLIAMRLSGITLRAGQILTGGGFLLTHPVKFDAELHVINQNLYLLNQLGLPIDFRKIQLSDMVIADTSVREEMNRKSNLLGNQEKFIVIHPVCEVPSREWPIESWVKLIDEMNPLFDIVLVGAGSDREKLEAIKIRCKKKPKVAPGIFSFPELTYFFKKSSLFIGINSSPGHLAAMVGTPVISLFSGTEPPVRWQPYGSNVFLFHKKTECWPCDLSECPFENHCMRLISPREVLEKVDEILLIKRG